jgi:hypothetical protein
LLKAPIRKGRQIYIFRNSCRRIYVKANIVGYSFAVVKGIKISSDKPSAELEPIRLAQGTTTTEEILVESEKARLSLKPIKRYLTWGKTR